MSKQRTNQLHVTVLQSIITSNIPFAFLENRYFRKYQQMLAGSLYNLPSREKLISVQLPVLHAQYELAVQALLDKESYLTLSLDGWTDISGNSIYALMLVKGERFKIFLDVLKLEGVRHTAENLLPAVKASLMSKQVGLVKIFAVVTDNPSTMLSLCRFLKDESAAIQGIACCLHVLNLIVKDILKHPDMNKVVKRNKIIVNFFSASHFWHEHLRTYAAQHDIKHGADRASMGIQILGLLPVQQYARCTLRKMIGLLGARRSSIYSCKLMTIGRRNQSM